MPRKLIDIKGCRYGKLLVVEYVGNEKWKCICDCGNEIIRTKSSLRNGSTNCGCEKKTKLIDRTGMRYGYLTVIERDYSINNASGTYWKCKCDCGNIKSINGHNLGRGTISCGCYTTNRIVNHNTKHGMSKTKLYNVWYSMKNRCKNPRNKSYKSYGGRGIKVCDEWIASYENFYKWSIKNGYKDGLQIDRIDVNGNYEPNNCRWVEKQINDNNKRSNVYITYNGKTQTISDWGRELNIRGGLISQRLNNGWSIEEALNGRDNRRKRKK